MSITSRSKKMIAVALAATAVPAAGLIGSQPVGAHTGGVARCATASGHGYPNAVPPILAPPPCSELKAIEAAERQDGQAFSADPPADARYSDVEMNVYASVHK